MTSRQRFDQPVVIFQALIKGLNGHPLVFAVRAHILHIAREARLPVSRNTRVPKSTSKARLIASCDAGRMTRNTIRTRRFRRQSRQ